MKTYCLANLTDMEIEDKDEHKESYLENCRALIQDTLTLPREAMVELDVAHIMFSKEDCSKDEIKKQFNSRSHGLSNSR